MDTALFIARRIDLKGGGRRHGAGIVIAVTGIALALTVMMLSIAVMQGFKEEIRAKVTGFESQLTVTVSPDAETDGGGDTDIANTAVPVNLTPSMRQAILRAVPEARISVAATRPGVIRTTDNFAGLVFKASEPGSDEHAFLRTHITAGCMPSWNDSRSADTIAVSRLTATRLGLSAGDRVDGYFFAGGGMKMRRFAIGAIYDTHFSDYDGTIAFASLNMVRRLDRLAPGSGTHIDINGIASDDDIEPAARRLQNLLIDEHIAGRLPEVYRVDNVHRRGALYFNWLSLLDTNVIVILALMGAVSGFTLISSMFILILERVNMIGILKALGASNGLVGRMFILLAQRLVLLGLVIGNAAGLGIIALQSLTHVLPLDPDTYYLGYVPVSIHPLQVVILNIAVIAISALVLLLPSRIVATISPARSIRYD